jgi:hypothetical protein
VDRVHRPQGDDNAILRLTLPVGAVTLATRRHLQPLPPSLANDPDQFVDPLRLDYEPGGTPDNLPEVLPGS